MAARPTPRPGREPVRLAAAGRGPILGPVSVAAETKRARLPLAGGTEGAGVRVHPMRTANTLAMPNFFQRPSGPLPQLHGLGGFTSRTKWTPVPIPAFLV